MLSGISMGTKPGIRLIVSDVDRTLLTNAYVLPKRVVDAVRATEAAGIRVVLATARSPIGVSRYVTQLGLTGPTICFNGAWTGDLAKGCGFDSHTLGNQAATDVMEFAQAAGLSPMWYEFDRVHVIKRNDLTEREAAKTGEPLFVTPLADLVAGPHKIMCIADRPEHLTKIEAVREAFCGRLAMSSSHPRLLEICARGVSKGTAVANLAGSLGFKPDQCAAAGDAENDLEMLAWAGVALTVGNAIPEAKRLAHYVGSSCDQGGIAEGFNWILQEQVGRTAFPDTRPLSCDQSTPRLQEY